MPKPKQKSGPLGVEDTLNDLLALVRFGLFQAANTTEKEFAHLHAEWCTMMYLMEDKTLTAQELNAAVTVSLIDAAIKREKQASRDATA